MHKVLITGGAGFIGSHLAERLAKTSLVTSIDDYSNGSEYEVPGVKYLYGKSSQIDKLRGTPDIVYHLGEFSRVLPSFDEIEKVAESSIGTLKVLEYCRRNRVKLVYAGSSTKFGDVESPYSFFKSHHAELIKKYGEWFGFQYAICYFYNVYGPREKGTLISNFLEAKTLKVNAPGTQKRIFTHVDDIVDGLILIGEKGSGEYCLGSEEEYTVLEVAEMFGKPIEMQPKKKGDRSFSSIDLTRSKELGWKAKKSLKEWIQHSVGQKSK